MASSNWKADELRDKNPMVADVINFLITKIEGSTTTAIELGDQLRKHIKLAMVDRAAQDTHTLIYWLNQITTAYAFVRYVLKEEAVAATEVISHHKKKDDEIVRHPMRHIPVIGDPKPYLLKRAEEFAKLSTWAGSHIGKLGGSLITAMTLVDDKVGTLGHSLGVGMETNINVKNNYTILVHGSSKLFGLVFLETLKMMKRKGNKKAILNFICTEEGPQDTTQLRHSTNLANGYGIPLDMQFQLQHASMAQVDRVFVDADYVYVNGAILSDIGTFQIAKAAASASIHVYVLAEGHKFSVEFPKEFSEEVLLKARDYTPPEYLKMIVSNGGVIPPSSVAGDIYAGLLSP